LSAIVTDTALGARTIRKLRWRILPFICLLYVVAYLDRFNIGFAALTMNKELGISSQQFGLLVGTFFFGYVLFEVPSNLLMHRIGARVWIARILLTWGIVALLTGFVRNVHELYAARFLLGLAEAGYYPGVVLYLTYWFRHRERAHAVAMVLIGIPITSIFGGPISGMILDHIHWMGLSSWRWLLVLEALPSIACGVLAYFILPERPETAKFLSAEEKTWILSELAQEREKLVATHEITVAGTFLNPRVWHLGLIQFTALIGSYSLSSWMPQLVKALSSHYSNTVIGWLVVIPQVVGLVSMVLVSRNSDRTRERRYHAAISTAAGGLGWLLLSATSSPLVSMVALSLVAGGAYSFFGPFWSIPCEFLTGYAAASGIALINSVGNLSGFVGPFAIGFFKNRTGSMFWGLLFIGTCMLSSAVLLAVLPQKARTAIRGGTPESVSIPDSVQKSGT
jgi:MFS transporter, ACS family, tartrate transporter